MKSRNSIFEIDHTVSLPAVAMNKKELSNLQCPIYPDLERNSSEISKSLVKLHGINQIIFNKTDQKCLGIGQYASVYRGSASFSLPDLPGREQSVGSTDVAIKVGQGGLLSHIKIKLESQILRHFRHQNIIKFIYESEQDGIPMLVLEYLPFGNVYEWVTQNRKKVDKSLWLKWSKQIANALDYVHRLGVIHNDVKPHNIMDLDVKLCDFGNSCFVPEANQTLFDNCQDIDKYDKNSCFVVTPPLISINPGAPRFKDSQILFNGAARGTLAYSAPELLSNEAYSFQADIYSFGIVLYFLASGLEPFARSKSNIYIFMGIKKGFFDSGMQAYWDGKYVSGEQVSLDIIKLIHHMLDLNQHNRPYAHQVLDVLEKIDSL